MSPILLRPVREQLEHDRVIRLLQAKYRRRFDVAINPGSEQTAPITVGQSPWYPDLVLQSQERGRKLRGVVEVETAESVNNLEAMSQWATFARQRVPLHLYVPAISIDVAKRLCADLQIPVAELWAYHAIGDQVRFTLVQRSSRGAEEKARAAARPRPAARAGAAARSRVSRPRRTSVSTPRGKAAKKGGTRAAGARRGASRPSRQKRK
ncbi:MAG: hypothetical protein HYU37_18870 [Acidobacteria bacterium]|nr:hypothetical protein [Acidobacteriota bacterium]